MKIRRILGIAAAFCMLWTAAAADGYGYGYGAPVNLMQQSARPYHWDLQVRDNGDEMTWKVDALLDGYRGTKMEHVCWNNESLDDIPEITFYFPNSTIKDIWIRNGFDNTDELFRQYARPYYVCVTVWVGNEEYPRNTFNFRIPDEWDSTVLNAQSYDGYRCLSLPQTFVNVTKLELWIKGWHKGDDAFRSKYIMQISDMAFLPDSLTALYGSAGDGHPGAPARHPGALHRTPGAHKGTPGDPLRPRNKLYGRRLLYPGRNLGQGDFRGVRPGQQDLVGAGGAEL